jgi:hypothetical protein
MFTEFLLNVGVGAARARAGGARVGWVSAPRAVAPRSGGCGCGVGRRGLRGGASLGRGARAALEPVGFT